MNWPLSHSRYILVAGLYFSLGACGKSDPMEAPATNAVKPEAEISSAAPARTEFLWPSSLKVMGDGYPIAGAPCRRIGESPATVDYLDDNASLIGCPGTAQDEPARAVIGAGNGHVVGSVDGVTLISVR